MSRGRSTPHAAVALALVVSLPVVGLHAAAETAAEPAASVPALSLHATSDEPRAFGWRVGDMVQRRMAIDAPAGWTLDPSSLPPLGRHGTALELRSLRSSTHRHLDGSHRIDLQFDYQVFVAPKEVRTFELPALRVGFQGKPGGAEARVDAWPLNVSPLAPNEPQAHRGLGDFRPDADVPRIDTTAARRRIWWWSFGILLGLLYLAQVYIGLPWGRSRRRPFEAAWRHLRRTAASDAPTAVPDAYRTIHGALNQAARGVLFARGVDGFVAAAPAYAVVRRDLLEFFERSRAVFFAQAPSADRAADLAWLLGLGRRLRDAERGSA